MVKISINEAHPAFAGLDMRHVRVVLGSLDDPSIFWGFTRAAYDNNHTGDVGGSHSIFEVSVMRPIIFQSNYDFALLGNVNDPFQFGRGGALLVDYIRKGVLILEKDGVSQTADQVIQFTP